MDKIKKKILEIKFYFFSTFRKITVGGFIKKFWPNTLQGGSEAEQVSALKNQLAEVEEEKGSLQLKLVDFDDLKALQGKEDKQ